MKQLIGARGYSGNAELTALVLTLLWLAAVCACTGAQDSPAPPGQPAHHLFTPFSTAKAIPIRGALRASAHTFKAEDETLVCQSDDWFKSPNDARIGLDTLTKKASRVIKQNTKTDAKGAVLGKRVELLLSRGPEASPEMVIAWTDGADLVRLTSTSMPLLLDFERQYYPGAEGDKERF
jgi:hypothetical protein